MDGDAEARYDRWVFSFDRGSAYLDGYTEGKIGYLMWPVRDGYVLQTPMPHAVFLFGSGLIGLVTVARRRSVR